MKRLLGRMEQFVEGVVESIFGRRADSLPAGILRLLATEIEREKVLQDGKTWAPCDCHILLTREAMRLVLPIQGEIEDELRTALTRFAARAGLTYPKPPHFRFATGDGAGVAVLSAMAKFDGPLSVSEQTALTGEGTGPTRIHQILGDPADRAWLRVESGPDLGREFPLIQAPMLIGRQIECHIVLSDPKVSREHARVFFGRGGYYLEDINSTNGTYINGRRTITRQRLMAGDRVQIGQTIMLFQLHRPGANAAKRA